MNTNFEQHIERCVVRVLGRTENGTGFWVLPEGYCLTCFHVILDRRRKPTPDVNIQYGNRLLKARYCPDLSRPDSDIAVLKVDDTQSVLIDYVILGLAELDAQVRVFGFREDEGYRITGQLQLGQSLKQVGEVHNLAHTSMPDGTSIGGMSGAPVYDHRRQIVVGMFYGQERKGPAVGYVHPIEKVYESWPSLEARNAATLRSGLQRFESMTAQAAEDFARHRASHPYSERSEFREIRTRLLDLAPFQPDFWIVVGQAGIGKSTLLLHLLQWSQQDGRYFPIWLDQDCFSNHSQRLLQLFDCPVSDWGSRLQDYAKLIGRPLLLFVDSLDVILPSLDPTRSATGLHDLAQSLVLQLNELASNAVLICSSRPTEYELISDAGIPRAQKLEIDELSENQVRQIVSQAAKSDYNIQIDKLDPKLIEMCRNPFILHLLLESSKMEPLPEISGRTATHIKELYWRKRVERVRPEAFVDYRFGALEKPQVARAKATIAHRIARAMVKAQAYRLPMKTLEDTVEEWIVEVDSDDRAAIWSVYRELVAEGVVTERNAVTFLHDSFADFVICREILSSDRPYQEIDRWLENIGSPFYVTVTVRLILQARDTAKSHIESRIYDGMLATLARKRESQAMMNRSWGVTYALRQVAYVWVERLCASLQEHCSQETASSIASVLEDMRHPAVVPALIDGMQHYQFKKRFVDGLGKSEDPSAVEPLLALLDTLP